ncbi:MAG: hypothetical protein NUV56_03480, partial [Candidatus Uhrbacteria bacterium]|nr:hypothetical protein [Candidatus Uhrbacteria bacterium]
MRQLPAIVFMLCVTAIVLSGMFIMDNDPIGHQMLIVFFVKAIDVIGDWIGTLLALTVVVAVV